MLHEHYGLPSSWSAFVQDHFVGTAGAAVFAGAAWNRFIELKSVLYTPHPSGTPRTSQARSKTLLERHPYSELRRERNSNRCARPEEISQTACGDLKLLQASDGRRR
jgi:hypothetical protein